MERDSKGKFVNGHISLNGFLGKKHSEEAREKIRNRLKEKKSGILKKCLICNKDFYCYPYEINKKKFCSMLCFNLWEKEYGSWNRGLTGIKTNNKGQISWNKGLTKETSKIIKQYSDKLQGHSFDLKTLQKMSEARKGKSNLDKHWNWQGGKSFEPYSLEFNLKFKNQIRKRDNQICMNCEIHREKLKYSLDVHHINYDKLLSINENCISLCRKCHILTNYNREYWKKLFQDKLSKLYDYKYDKIGNIILEVSGDGNS